MKNVKKQFVSDGIERYERVSDERGNRRADGSLDEKQKWRRKQKRKFPPAEVFIKSLKKAP